MSLEELQQSIDGAAQAIDGRLARDAETIRQLTEACRAALSLTQPCNCATPEAWDERAQLARDLPKMLEAAIDRADPCPF